MKTRVVLVHNVIAPYRLPLFELLAEHPSIDLEVLYCSTGASLFKWDFVPKKYSYRYKVMPSLTQKFSFLNPTIIFEITKRKPDVIIIDGYVDITMQLAYVLSKIMKVPVVLWVEGIKEPTSLLGIISRPVRMLFFKKADAVIVPGNPSKNYVTSMGASESKVFIAPNCIDNDFFIEYSSKYQKTKESLKKKFGISSKNVILYVGQLIERKGVDYLIGAYERLKQEHDEVALVLVGSGPLKAQIGRMCDKRGISDVFFVESGLKLADLIQYYSIADIFVLPTLFDVWGFVINEAMTCGLPVVATRASQAALDMIICGENGYVVKEGNSEELYYAFKKLVLNPIEREQMGRKSKEIVLNRFAISHMVQGFLSAINYTKYKKGTLEV